MRTLVIFADMLRANRLSSFNNELKSDTPIDVTLKKLGGTIFQNCFTPGPDTPRGISAAISGTAPYLNGCDVRLKWPREFLKPELNTIYDLFIDEGYKIDIFSDPKERAVGLFPKNISNMNVHNKNYDIDNYIDNLVIEDKHFIFLSLPQFHWTIDAYGESLNGERNAQKDISESFDSVFRKLDKDLFDHIFIFSDHGFKLAHEMKLDPDYRLINDDRTHTVMMHREKFQNQIDVNTKLCSLTDIYPTIQDILGQKIERGISLLSSDERHHVVIEDHINFTPSINQNIELWAVVDSKHIYIRTLEEGILIDRASRMENKCIIDKYDIILENESSYKKYKSEYEKIFVYSQNLQKNISAAHNELYDFRKKKRSILINYIHKATDIFLEYLKRLTLRK